MPYLHYEKRCDQAKIHKIIMDVKQRARWAHRPRHWNDQTKDHGEKSPPTDSDDDHTSIRFTSYESLEPAASPARGANRGLSRETQRLLAEDDEITGFLSAEAALIEGYQDGQKKLHVSTLDHALFFGFQSQQSRLEEHLISLTTTSWKILSNGMTIR